MRRVLCCWKSVFTMTSVFLLKWFAFPFPVDHILSELYTTTRLHWVPLHDMDHSFIELHEAVIHMFILVSFVIVTFVLESVGL